MDWIERIFGIAPDGGSGATEISYAVAVAFIAAAFLLGRALVESRDKQRRKSRD